MVQPFDKDMFTGQVDFRISENHNNWRILTFLTEKQDSTLVGNLSRSKLLDKFKMETRQIGTGNKVGLTFHPLATNSKERADTRRRLIRCLSRNHLPVIWKEGKYGYEINKSGRIERTWKLNRIL